MIELGLPQYVIEIFAFNFIISILYTSFWILVTCDNEPIIRLLP